MRSWQLHIFSKIIPPKSRTIKGLFKLSFWVKFIPNSEIRAWQTDRTTTITLSCMHAETIQLLEKNKTKNSAHPFHNTSQWYFLDGTCRANPVTTTASLLLLVWKWQHTHAKNKKKREKKSVVNLRSYTTGVLSNVGALSPYKTHTHTHVLGNPRLLIFCYFF